MTNVIELEEWRPVPEFEDLYEVSNMGRVKSVDRTITRSDGQLRKFKGKMKKQSNDTQGRLIVGLSKDNKAYNKYLHSLVALAFIGERPEGYHVCHINGDNQDNRLVNLRYDTASENTIDIYRYGKKHGMGKLSIDEVLEIRRLYATGKYKQIELVEKFNVNASNISKIVRRKNFPWLNDDGSIDDSTTSVS